MIQLLPTAARVRRGNLPAELSSFVGREAETAEVTRLLTTSRLVTLIGSPGVGKTRLALQVAEGLADGYADEVWLVELAPLTEPELVPHAVAATLGLSEQQGRPLLEALAEFLRPMRLLLVLDNCEHLLEACAVLVERVLRACPELRVVATSREALSISGETSWRVPSLSLPDLTQPAPVDTLAGYEAVSLFVERASAADSTFRLTGENAAALAGLCHRLDGVPLALELAAARVGVLTVEQIVAKLDDRFGLLTTGSRTSLPRQRTLRALVDWSYELLTEPERALLRRLAVFAGGWTLEAAEAVCSDREKERETERKRDGETESAGTPLDLSLSRSLLLSIAPGDVLEALAQLVGKSLVLMEERGGAARYRFLETIREYSWEKLRDSGEEAAQRERHRDWFLELAERAEVELHGPEQVVWLDRLGTEHDNLRAALAWSFIAGAGAEYPSPGLRLGVALSLYWRVRNHFSEGRRWLAAGLAAETNGAGSLRVKALFGAGLLAFAQGDREAARAQLEASVALARELGDQQEIGWSLQGLGRVINAQGAGAEAQTLFEQSLDALRAAGDAGGVAFSIYYLGTVAQISHDHARAARLLDEALAQFRQLGDSWGSAWVLIHQARVAYGQRDFERADLRYTESLTLCRALRTLWGTADCLDGLAWVAGARGQPERAARLCGAVANLRGSIGMPPIVRAEYDRNLAELRAKLEAGDFETAWAAGQAMPLERAMDYALSRPEAAAETTKGAEVGAVASRLTPRERQVTALIARGLTNRQIAAELVIGERTAETHAASIRAKLSLDSRAQVAVWVAEHGLPPSNAG